MADRLLNLYHALPAPLRSAAATMRGFRLRWWRYGPGAERLVEEALEREAWAPERLQAWVDERLARLLHRSASRVPYYRDHWAERRRRGDNASIEQLENWPLLPKDVLRARPEAFVADDRDTRRLFPVNTSGTTGTPLRLWRSRKTGREYYALLEARYRRWHGVTWREPWAILGGQAVVPPDASGPPYWVWNGALHQLYLSANHVSARNAPAFVGALTNYKVRHLVAYASSAAELARQCLEAGQRFDGFRVVVANAEPVHPWQRDVIRRAFGVETRETYGMVEIVAGASECPSGTRHQWPELGRIEVLDDAADVPAAAGTVGRLVCTGLVNDDMPLIRYVVGDRGGAPGPSACSCGRRLPVMGTIEGRSNDMLIAPDGRRVYWVNPVFYGLAIHEAQIIQESRTEIRVLYVPGSGFTRQAEHEVIERLLARLGQVQVTMEEVPAIPRGANGKFRAVVNRLSASFSPRQAP